MAPRNPWAVARNEPEFSEPDYPGMAMSRYAVPTPGSKSDDAPYADSPVTAWAPHMRISPRGYPDASRLQQIPRRDFRPEPARPPEEFYGYLDRDDAFRHSVEKQDADGWTETKNGLGHPDSRRGANRFAPNPREVPPDEPRLTQTMAPRSYSFWRPFQGMTPHRFTGDHFSMADHRRKYEIYGMAPQRRPGGSSRNTYRLPPAPWDINVVDMPPDQDLPDATWKSVEVPSPSRSWRLG
jgi:hypothetical protein